MAKSQHDFVVVANRLPIDVSIENDGLSWNRAPGGLVSALAPVMENDGGAWVGWSGAPDQELEPFDADGIWVHPVRLSESDVELYYEGFSNATLWPLYHDVIVDPEYHREWWNVYRTMNVRFATAAAQAAAHGATVWVHDYQLQLVPSLLRQLRPDLTIGFFLHIPFPPLEIFGQIPWRSQIVTGLLGADLVGFQRPADTANFLRAVRRYTSHPTRGYSVNVSGRTVRAATYPISIDTEGFAAIAQDPAVVKRSEEIRAELGNPEIIMLGVDRLDYTKGIRHRLKAIGELYHEGKLLVPEHTMIQVASPSREEVEKYIELRQQIENTVGAINGDYGQIGSYPIQYLHHSYPAEEMAALYLAADVMIVSSLRDGMNLVAKEYIATREDLTGTLVLSEFTGAADELTSALIVNPHDIEGMKSAIMRAVEMRPGEQRRRMRAMRRKVIDFDVQRWADAFMRDLAGKGTTRSVNSPANEPTH